MKKRNKNNQWLYSRFFIPNIIFIAIVSFLSLGIIYYWSFYHFSNIFEDRVIDEYTLKYSEDLGIKNEWLLGVTTHSVDVLEATHGKATRDYIESCALEQEEIYKLYKEKVDGKHLIYTISLDNSNGEFLYKYSVIKDIYAEIFPNIAITFAVFSVFIMFLSYIYVKFVSGKLYSSINKLEEYAHKLAALDLDAEPVEIVTNDRSIKSLAETFKEMQIKLSEKEKLQKTTLQYISHEMKTPIMIIESYTTSAKDGIYPKDTLEASLDTILAQAERMKIKVASLLKIVELNTKDIIKTCFNLSELANNIITNYKMQINSIANYIVDIQPDVMVSADKEKIQILIENLVENQFKYCKELIAIRIFRNKDKTILLFFNDGYKISENLKSKLFMPFVKGYNDSNGLGLSICKTILLQHKSDIKIIDTNFGTLFKIELKDF